MVSSQLITVSLWKDEFDLRMPVISSGDCFQVYVVSWTRNVGEKMKTEKDLMVLQLDYFQALSTLSQLLSSTEAPSKVQSYEKWDYVDGIMSQVPGNAFIWH